MLSMKKKAIILSSVITSSLGIYIIVSAIFPNKHVPNEFSEARIKSSELAKTIVVLADNSLENLDQIARLDQKKSFAEALNLVSEEITRNREAHQEAIKLASQLERMARSITSIKPSEAQVFATEAVSSEVALVSRLISYNDYLLQLFDVLGNKFQSGSNQANGKVGELITKINEEARAINSFDKKVSESLAEFDKLIQ